MCCARKKKNIKNIEELALTLILQLFFGYSTVEN